LIERVYAVNDVTLWTTKVNLNMYIVCMNKGNALTALKTSTGKGGFAKAAFPKATQGREKGAHIVGNITSALHAVFQ
jgi:hypothetical protein